MSEFAVIFISRSITKAGAGNAIVVGPSRYGDSNRNSLADKISVQAMTEARVLPVWQR